MCECKAQSAHLCRSVYESLTPTGSASSQSDQKAKAGFGGALAKFKRMDDCATRESLAATTSSSECGHKNTVK